MNKKTAVYLLISLLTITALSVADSPPANTIPIIGLRSSFEDVDTEFFCFLSWNFFDGASRFGQSLDYNLHNFVLHGDTTGMLTIISPVTISCEVQWYARMFPMTADSPYVKAGWNGYVIDATTTCTHDTILASRTALFNEEHMEGTAEDLAAYFADSSHSVWFYYGSDEAPARQWNRMVTDSINHVYSAYDDYMPNMFTQAMDSVYRPDLDGTMKWQPTLEEVDPYGDISWMNYHIKQADPTREFLYIISCMMTINSWADFNNLQVYNNFTPPNYDDQEQAIRSIFDMKYQGYPSDSVQSNYPSCIALDAYPFRHVGTAYQIQESYTPKLGSTLENSLIDLYEEGMDVTFITASDIRNDESKDISVFFAPQVFGRAGGEEMWDTLSTPAILSYGSYGYRIPTPQEFRMTCNSGLLRGAKAILPYCLASYMGGGEQNVTDVALLDENNIPFDTPYEEWAYRDRPIDSLSYISPDLIPPFMRGYDPLYTLPARPILIQGSERNREIVLLWKFAPYGRLWRSVRKTFGQIARVAPELALLDWWEGYENEAAISYDRTPLPLDFRSPQIKVFTDSLNASCYLYYLNRYFRTNNTPFEIVVDINDFPDDTPFSEYALDHNRRFLIEGQMTARDEYTFLDTLDAGEARLMQMIDDDSLLAADIRITDPDLVAILPAKGDTLTDYTSTEGEQIHIQAYFNNMGMSSLDSVQVYLYDDTDNALIGTAEVSFNGLSTDSCYQEDRDGAIFVWQTDSTDIGVHRLSVYTEQIFGEPDPNDNSASLVFVITPKDYATEVLNDPWDMTEATTSIPSWYTNDIDSLTGSWNTSAYTDSISGMFEGVLSVPSSSNALYLNIGSGPSTRINANKYFNFSIAGRAERSLWIKLHWIDWQGSKHNITLDDGFVQTAHDLGPYNLSGNGFWSGEIKKIWLEFGGSPLSSSVRIGWIKLTE